MMGVTVDDDKLPKKILTAVLNTEYGVEYKFLDNARVYVPSYTTRIQEVENPGTPLEREKPEGDDRGFLWRFNNYCSSRKSTSGQGRV